MKTPVIIPAFNEAAHIRHTLDMLDATQVEPIVIVNGEQRDDTADIARNVFGSTVYERKEPGKLPAIQYALRRLGNNALEPLLLLDADSYPIRPAKWPSHMLSGLAGNAASAVAGPVLFSGGNIIDDTLRSIRSNVRARVAARQGSTLTYGANMALHIFDDKHLDSFLAMQHIWLGDDRAMRDVVTADGGVPARQRADIGSCVMTSARYLDPLFKRIGANREATTINAYARRAPATAQFTYSQSGALVPISEAT